MSKGKKGKKWISSKGAVRAARPAPVLHGIPPTLAPQYDNPLSVNDAFTFTNGDSMTLAITEERITFLKQYFSYQRPEGGTGQELFTRTYLSLEGLNPLTDGYGNIHVDLREGPANRTLFTAHTDTVHYDDGRQIVAFDPATSMLSLAATSKASCLGADDGAGVLVLLHLIRNRVPAYYVFTRCEERGGKGAKFLVDTLHAKDSFLKGFDRAIAFDRKATASVITHQGWGRCCSDAFGEALSNALGTDTLMYAPDSTGVYTDTAEFVGIIPECTNVSVGYYNEHTKGERLDIRHLFDLMAHVVTVDWDALPTVRDPACDPDTLDDWSYWADYDKGVAPGYRGLSLTDGWLPAAEPNYGHQPDNEVWTSTDSMLGRVFDALDDAYKGYYDELLWLTADISTIGSKVRAVDVFGYIQSFEIVDALGALDRMLCVSGISKEQLIEAMQAFYTRIVADNEELQAELREQLL